MALLDTSALFQLGQVHGERFGHPTKFDRLPKLEESFSLPTLDEHAPGRERILAGLAELNQSQRGSRSSSPSRKGKEREVVDEAPVDGGKSDGIHSVEDLWANLRLDEAGPSRPRTFERLRTWDTYGEAKESIRNIFSARPGLINVLEHDTHPDPVTRYSYLHEETNLPRDADDLLRLLLESTLGTTTSDQLVWDKRKSTFRWTGRLVQDRSSSTSESAAKLFLDIGTAIRRLEVIVDTHSTTPATPTHHALLHTVSTYLTYLKQELSQMTHSGDRETLFWHAESTKLREIHELAVLLCDIMQWPLSTSRAEGLPVKASLLLTHLHAFLLTRLSTSPASSHTVLAAAYLLSQSSGPFLSLLHGWLGLASVAADQDTDPHSQPWADMGITRTPASISDNGEPRWKYEFSSKRMPGFIPKECRRALFEAGKSLRLLREASNNQHPLCTTSWQIEVGWGWGEARPSSSKSTVRLHLKRVKNEIETWQRDIEFDPNLKGSSSSLRLNIPRKERKRIPVEFTKSPSTMSISLDPAPADGEIQREESHLSVDPIWAQFSLPPGSHLNSVPNPLWAPSPLDGLRTFLSYHSEPSSPITADSPSLSLYISSHLLKPLLEHGKLISISLVSLYLDDLHLLDYYEILKAFFLGGDYGFAERVSAALFGKDEAGAGEALGLGKRARTRARLGLGGEERSLEGGVWGIGLGLGLSERARWPPGGAELAYALRTTLLDDEVQREGVWRGIADRISFAVKSLPEDDKDGQRARWLDPQAIEALDFLYLSYSAPRSVSPLLPTALMEKYQSIQNLLLRVGRVKTVVRSLYIDTVHPTPLFDEPVKQGIDSGSRPDSRASSRQDRGVQTLFPPGEKASSVLHRLRFRMSGFVAAIERYLLDIAIGANWDVMYRKLDRLRRNKLSDHSTSPEPNDPVDEPLDVIDVDNESDEEDESGGIIQLQSVDSLVVYHHLIMDRILRASLLAPSAGHQVTYKVLMGLFGCVLDLGKVVKEMERGYVGWLEGAGRVQAMAKEWDEREGIFLHALERLSLRTNKTGYSDEYSRGEGDERDLEILLGSNEGDEAENDVVGADGGNLGELLIRLKFGSTAVSRGGRWKGDAAQ